MTERRTYTIRLEVNSGPSLKMALCDLIKHVDAVHLVKPVDGKRMYALAEDFSGELEALSYFIMIETKDP